MLALALSAAWLLSIALALAICRLGGRSDERDGRAAADWVAECERIRRRRTAALRAQPVSGTVDRRRSAHGAAG